MTNYFIGATLILIGCIFLFTGYGSAYKHGYEQAQKDRDKIESQLMEMYGGKEKNIFLFNSWSGLNGELRPGDTVNIQGGD